MPIPTPRVLDVELERAEGPVVLDDGRLVYCDFFPSALKVWDPRSETVGIFTDRGLAGPNGCRLGSDGYVYVADNGGDADLGGSIRRVKEGQKAEIILDTVDGRPLHKPNDLSFAPDGSLWFTDSARYRPDDPEEGFIYRIAPDGTARLVVEAGRTFPNGIVVDDDGTVYWVQSLTHTLHRYTERGGAELIYTYPEENSFPDGMALTADRQLYVGTLFSGGYSVHDLETGAVEFFPLGVHPSNLAFGAGGMYVTEQGPVVVTDGRPHLPHGQLLHYELPVRAKSPLRGSISPA